MIEINLLPGATRKTRGGRSFNPGALVTSVTSRVKDPYLLGMVAALVVAVLAVGGLYLQQSSQRRDLEARQDVAVRDSARMSSMLKARVKAEAARDSVYMQVAIIKSIDDSRYRWPHLLEEINLALPPYTWLTDVTQTSAVSTAAGLEADSTKKADPKADPKAAEKKPADQRTVAKQKKAHADSLFNGVSNVTKFHIQGQTVDIQALTLFMKNLEGSPFIKNVQLTRSDLVSGERDVTQFELDCESEVPPPSILQKVPLNIAVR